MLNKIKIDKPKVSGKPSPRVGVIGGGPGGLAAAARLAQAGITVDVFEAGAELGGLARSISLWGREVELSAHIFRSSDDFVNNLWSECAGELMEISLRRGIYDGNHIIQYPMTPYRILRNLGIADTVRSVIGLGVGRVSNYWKAEPANAEEWMVRRYGRPLHERFLRDYAEKLWGVPCSQINAGFPQFLFQSADDSKDGEQSFLYPRSGNSALWNKLGEQLVSNGVGVHKNTRVSQVDVVSNTVTGLMANETQYKFDHVISTMPLGLLARLTLAPNAKIEASASVLKARSTVLVYVLAESGSHSDFNWLSIYPAHFRVGRITDFGQWLNADDGRTVYCLEYWCDRGDELWNLSDDAITTLAMSELNKTELVGDVAAIESHIERLPGTHPVFSLESQAAIDAINAGLNDVEGLSTVGRHGSHGVLGMGESMEAARQLADRIVADLSSA